MAETAAHLVDRVLPHVPDTQWVLSFPIPRHIHLAAYTQLRTLGLRPDGHLNFPPLWPPQFPPRRRRDELDFR